MSSIVLQYLQWHFIDQARGVFRAWKNFLKFGLNYFSIPLLLKTFCATWRRCRYSYPKSFDFKEYLDAFTFNAVSRAMGMIMRIILIIVGAISEFFIFLAGLVIFLLWLFLPILVIIGLISGIKLAF
jgi:hypothetical protein